MKKYYSSIKESTKVYRPHIIYKIFMWIVGLFHGKNEVIWKTEKPTDEPIFLVCNHTQVYAPTHFLVNDKNTRVWANYYFLFTKTAYQHITTSLERGNKNFKWLRPVVFVMSPVVALFFRAITPIPVYHKSEKVYTQTFEKSLQTLLENKPQVVFPERTKNPVNKYINQLNYGFPEIGKIYYERTGKLLKFFPVYCASKIKKVLVGEPIQYDPNIDFDTQKHIICKHLENQIGELGDSLGEHKVDYYTMK